MKIFLTGSKGQLAKEFIKRFNEKNIDFLALSKEELDISNFENVIKTIKEYKPDIIINCAAYNLVDKAEEEFEKAYAVNGAGVYNLAVASLETKSLLIHYSTDYVFDGKKEGLYTEEDIPNPLSRYAISKYIGERNIQNILERYIIFRVSWVYGKGKQNFLYKLNYWAKTQEYLKIACDEFSVPTSTRTIVDITLKSIQKGLTGLYHLTNSGYTSRFEWAREYLKLKKINKFIYPAYQQDFNLPAKRPRFSAMSNDKISKKLGICIKEWNEELKELIDTGEI